MRSPLLLLLAAFLFKDVCLSQQNRVDQDQPTITKPTYNEQNLYDESIALKLSPVPPEAEGLPSPPVPELLDSANHYFINQQGHLVLRPQRPQYGLGQGTGRPPPLNFHELPPSFPHLTDEELHMLGQPVPLHPPPPEGGEESSVPSATGLLPETQPNTINSSLPTIVLTQPPEAASSGPSKQPQMLLTRLPTTPNQPPLQPSEPPNLPSAPSYQLSASQNLPPKPSSQPSLPPKQPSATPSGPAGEYIATVSYGLSSPSLVYICSPRPHHSPGRYVLGPFGYHCKMFKARPSLVTELLAANNQRPVTQPVVSTEPVSLPIVTPIKFFDAIY